MPAAAKPRWWLTSLRVLLMTFLLTLLAFAVSLLIGILAIVINGRVRGLQPNLTLAYRHIALPVALIMGALALVVTTVLEVLHHRQARTLAGIARASR